jgi:hypothetical protein
MRVLRCQQALEALHDTIAIVVILQLAVVHSLKHVFPAARKKTM